MDWKSLVVILFALSLFPTILIWWKREAIKNAILEAQKLQDQIDRKRNETANLALRKKIADRKKRLADSVKPDDPWDGVR